jgi:hypothetical protein
MEKYIKYLSEFASIMEETEVKTFIDGATYVNRSLIDITQIVLFLIGLEFLKKCGFIRHNKCLRHKKQEQLRKNIDCFHLSRQLSKQNNRHPLAKLV